MAKTYDADYFQRWYHLPGHRLTGRAALTRKVALAVATAEYHLGRPIRSVLDVGCGEGAWRAPLRKSRPGVYYLGLDSSDYAVRRYGRSRNLRPVAFGQLAELRFDRRFDLLVCSDIMHYLAVAELRRGLSGFAELCQGVVFAECYCRGDCIEGDRDGFIARPANWYRRLLAEAGFVACGSHTWLCPERLTGATALELAPAGSLSQPRDHESGDRLRRTRI